ncbi:bifunctional Helicase superfamily 1-2 [Babesia duncani]|uniref:Bifunctional Helicase superfamily 1-2 n=1 Tax=Babesia duncani TaxID=323732 RepID=A0AAD9PLJ0_9APIC|nr:bifunctional Helicase superfamily 1-2 [Babesia duncani]
MDSMHIPFNKNGTETAITTTNFLKQCTSGATAHATFDEIKQFALDMAAMNIPGIAQTPKKRRLKQRIVSDSDSSSEVEQTPTINIKETKEYLKARRIILENLKSIETCLHLSKTVKEAVIKTMFGTSENDDLIATLVANGSCGFTETKGDLSCFSQVPMFDKLKRYQQCGVHWLTCVYNINQANVILADEMGLGKTAQTGVFLSWLYMQDLQPCSCLILVPTSLLETWAIELERWAPNLKGKIMKYHGSPNARVKIACEVFKRLKRGEHCILISTITIVSNREDIKLLKNIKEFEYAIVDEAHVLKNSDTIAYRRISNCFRMKHRLLLTGTPIQNNPDELGNLLQFAMPETFDQSRISMGISYLVQHFEDAVATVPAIAELYQGNVPKFNPDTTMMASNGYANPQGSNSNGDGHLESRKYNNSKDGVMKFIEKVNIKREHDDTTDMATNYGDGGSNSTELMSSDVKAKVKSEDNLENDTMGQDESESTEISLELRILQQLVAPFILRRLKNAVMHELPPKYSNVIKCKMQGLQHDLYKREMDFRIQQNLKGEDSDGTEQQLRLLCEGAACNAFARRNEAFVKSLIFRLRRICNHPLLVPGCFYTDEMLNRIISHYHSHVEGFTDSPLERVQREIRGWSDFELHKSIQTLANIGDLELKDCQIPKDMFLTSAKVKALFGIVENVYNNKTKALVFSQFTTYLDLLEECLSLHMPQVQFLRLDGTTLATSRREVVDVFSADENITLLLVSTKAGGVGLNLTAAQTVILMDQDWNPHNDLQAIDRAHRIGQYKPVHVYRLCCKDSVEEYILQCNARKLKLDDAFGGRSSAQDKIVLKED